MLPKNISLALMRLTDAARLIQASVFNVVADETPNFAVQAIGEDDKSMENHEQVRILSAVVLGVSPITNYPIACLIFRPIKKSTVE